MKIYKALLDSGFRRNDTIWNIQMVVGILTIQLYIHECNSLKGKRQALKSIKQRVRNTFNVSIAEVGNTELWQRATLAVSYVNQDKREVDSLFSKLITFIEDLHKAEITDYASELISFNSDL